MPAYTAPPTLEQLLGLLDAAGEARATRETSGNRTHFVFSVDNEKLAELGGSFYANGPGVLQAIREAVERLHYIDDATKQYNSPDAKGSTAADCQAFIQNELKNVGFSGLEANMRRRFYNSILQKLVELGVWRAAVDAKRFENQKEAERKRREEQKRRDEEIKRAQDKMWEDMRKQEERMKEKQERERRESAAGSERDSKSRQEGFGFEDSFYRDFNEAFRNRRYWKDESFGFGGTSSNAGQKEQPKTKARNKTRDPWHIVLGVPITAKKDEIKKAWRLLVKELHPDKPENRTPEKLEKLKDVNTAYEEGIAGAAA